MTALSDIKAVAEIAARDALRPTDVVDVAVERGIGAYGDELLWVTIAIPDGAIDGIDGGRLIETLTAIQHRVRDAGEAGLAIVRYTTPSERIDHGDPES